MLATSLTTVGHVSLAFLLTFLLGFEREIRGSAAGDRTFSLIGVGTAVIGVLAAQGNALSILSGAVTGVGFIGAGLLFRGSDQSVPMVHGVTTAASIVAAGGIGAAAGEGQLWLAVIATALVIFILEMRYIPGVRMLDARVWASHFKDDTDPHHRSTVTVTVTSTTTGSGENPLTVPAMRAAQLATAESADQAAAASTSPASALDDQAEDTGSAAASADAPPADAPSS
jgi:putative Mg2+ transporter-C (MgtC) family protein